MIAADAAGGDDHGLRLENKVSGFDPRGSHAARFGCRFENFSAHAGRSPTRHVEGIDAVPESEDDAACIGVFAGAPLERLDNAGAGAPGDMESGNRVAVPHGVIAAALGPADHRKNPVSHRPQPVAFLAGCESDIGFGPFSRPVILVAIKTGGPEPVLQCEVVRILDAEPPLLGRVDQKQPAERPEGLSADILLAFLIDDDHSFAGIGEFGGGHEASQSRADDDCVRIVRHFVSPPVPELKRSA